MQNEYELRFHPEFFKDLKKLNKEEKERLVKNYKKIKENPSRFKHLGGRENCYSVRIGSLRVIYYLEGRVIWFLVLERRKIVYGIYLKRLHSLKEHVKNHPSQTGGMTGWKPRCLSRPTGGS